MIIDGKSTRLAETKEVNKYIDEAWGDPHAIVTEDSEVFLELTDGSRTLHTDRCSEPLQSSPLFLGLSGTRNDSI